MTIATNKYQAVHEVKAEYVDHMGDDLTIVNAARVSFGSHKDVLEDKDVKLVKYLAEHKHLSPFEHCVLGVRISCPLYIRSQIHRHRTFSYNEISRRYTSKDMEFFEPKVVRAQAKKNRQASDGVLSNEAAVKMKVAVMAIHSQSFVTYNNLLSSGVSREQARGVLPQNLMTEFYMTGNLRNWCHFIELRTHEGAQEEVQDIARQVMHILMDKFPIASEKLLVRAPAFDDWIDEFFFGSSVNPDILKDAYDAIKTGQKIK